MKYARGLVLHMADGLGTVFWRMALGFILAAWAGAAAALPPTPFLVKDLDPDVSTSTVVLGSAGGNLFFQIKEANTFSLWHRDDFFTAPLISYDNVFIPYYIPPYTQTMYINDSGVEKATAFKNQLFFSVNDTTHGRELWRSDGTPAGTAMVLDIEPGGANSFGDFVAYSSDPDHLTRVGSDLFFSAYSLNGRGLWKTDGSQAGTVTVKAFTSEAANTLNNFVAFNGLLFFTLYTSVHGTELWKSDGTTANTVKVLDLHHAVKGSILYPTVAGGNLLFFGNDGVSRGLWKSDGITSSAELVKELDYYAGPEPVNVVAGGLLFFRVRNGTDWSLWRSDGTAAGTFPVCNLGLLSTLSVAPGPAASGAMLLFDNQDGAHGRELWKSDGTAMGTVMLMDICEGTSGSAPAQLTAFGGAVYFTADDGVHGAELWRSDGTPQGTAPVADLAAGPLGSKPGGLMPAGDLLYFLAAQNGEKSGRDIWAVGAVVNGARDWIKYE